MGKQTMLKFRETLLAASCILAATVAAAGPVAQGRLMTIAAYPECAESAALGTEKAAFSDRQEALARDGDYQQLSANDDTIEEYLSFHAQVTEENGKFSLMPWSGLRTHAN
jgi:hypothetical protein